MAICILKPVIPQSKTNVCHVIAVPEALCNFLPWSLFAGGKKQRGGRIAWHCQNPIVTLVGASDCVLSLDPLSIQVGLVRPLEAGQDRILQSLEFSL